MRKLIITLFLFLTFISYAKVQLFNNPIFNKFVKYHDKSIQYFRKVIITLVSTFSMENSASDSAIIWV